MTAAQPAHDYIVIGSGAAGGTVAARLAEAGYRVLVLEAGPDPVAAGDREASAHYRVPVFHAMASESAVFGWPYRVSHFDDPATAALDRNAGPEGIFYPRAAALGGCTAHNAMIFMPPPDRDWDELATISGDEGWRAERLQRFRQLVERCRHRPLLRLLAGLGLDRSGHGWSGWLRIEKAMPLKVLTDGRLIRSLARIALADLHDGGGWRARLAAFVGNRGDPNDRARPARQQLCYLPLATRFHARTGTRERLLQARRRHPDRLELMTGCLATEILFEGKRAVGIAWQRGRQPMREGAAPGASGSSYAAREIIVACGAFGTPQLLMLSGIGDRAALESLGIPVRADVPEVGGNLQDRYEIAVVNRMAKPWRSLRGARFAAGDPLYRLWRWLRRGMYTSNGAAVAALHRSSSAEHDDPDLILLGLLGRFSGYRTGYAAETWKGLDGFTWAILKGQTRNRAGTVTLASRDPCAAPRIAFRNFAEGGDLDLDALVEGIAKARALSRPLIEEGLIAAEELPGEHVQGAALRDWARAHAWGHHACGTAAIGTVVDGRGRVTGVAGLRVADASIFPRIPGLFIAAAIMSAAEKIAADVLMDARSAAEDGLQPAQSR
jgi:choline dehydrogenase-like flavoprotein